VEFAVTRERIMGVRKIATLFMCAALLFTLSCDGKGRREDGIKKLVIVTTLFPLYDFARNIGQERADVSLLLPPGVEPHSFEPKPKDIVRIHEADLFVWTGGFMEPWAEAILKGVDREKVLVIDTSKGITLLPEKEGDGHKAHKDKGRRSEEMDPHIWLDFGNCEKMVDAIVQGFVKKDPAHKAFYERNGSAYKAKLQTLDERFRTALGTCETRVFVHGGHFAFNYLAARYNLRYVSVYGFSPDSEPSPKHLAEIISLLRRDKLKYIYYEELINPRVAEMIAREAGAQVLPLNGAHNVSREEMDKGIAFIDIMLQDLENLKKGLGCREK
jgi:zinc transport system substrate-binding protein